MNNKDLIIEITSCADCPFMNFEYDEYSINNSEIIECVFLEHIRMNNVSSQTNYFINIDKKRRIISKNNKTLDNCPLLKNNLKFKLK